MARRHLPVAAGLVAAVLLPGLAATGPVHANPAAPAWPAVQVRYEAESATISNGVVESNHAGFTGTGFVNYDNEVGGYVEWTVTAASSGTHTLTVRFANGTSTARPLDITVNGALVTDDLGFAGTGAWATWRTYRVTAVLAVGSNTVRARATGAAGGPNVDSLTVDDVPIDWSVQLVESTMDRFSPAELGGWSYPRGLYLYGQYLVYQRTRNPVYLSYLRAWVDRFVDSNGNIAQSFNNLDSMLSGRLLVIMHRETGLARYKTAADKIRNRLNTYPRTSDGGWWHATSESRQGQLWADGVFMVNPFLVEYGQRFGDSTFANNEATRQLTVYESHLRHPSGLLHHAFDEPGDESWSDPVTRLSPEFWGRAIGWFGMATVQILDILPADHPRRAALVAIVRNLVRGFSTFQDTTGRWFQVVDEGGRTGNWLETSCSMMYAYTVARAVQRGYVDAGSLPVAVNGYRGVLQKTWLGTDDRVNIAEISIGTNVGNYSYYIGRTRATNDFHGLGAFLIMNEALRTL